jgi:hypothetical protein
MMNHRASPGVPGSFERDLNDMLQGTTMIHMFGRLAPGIVHERLQNGGRQLASFGLRQPDGLDLGIIHNRPSGLLGFTSPAILAASLASRASDFSIGFLFPFRPWHAGLSISSEFYNMQDAASAPSGTTRHCLTHSSEASSRIRHDEGGMLQGRGHTSMVILGTSATIGQGTVAASPVCSSGVRDHAFVGGCNFLKSLGHALLFLECWKLG